MGNLKTIREGVLGESWVTHERGSYWGPFSKWKRTRPSYFAAMVIAQLDASAWWNRFHTTPPGFPLPLFGRPTLIIDRSAMREGLGFDHCAVDLLACFVHLDCLLLRVRLLVAESEALLALKE